MDTEHDLIKAKFIKLTEQFLLGLKDCMKAKGIEKEVKMFDFLR